MPLQRYSVYDHMDKKGVFAVNPANADSRGADGQSIYKGPLAYPKMFYHPQGAERQISPEHVEYDRNREFIVPAKFELEYKEAASPEEERKLRAAGWFDHPAPSIEAGNKIRLREGKALRVVPAMSSAEVAQRQALAAADEALEAKEAENEDLRAKLKDLEAKLALKH